MYANIIRQIENGLADWSKDFREIETPILIKYVKTGVKNKKSVQFGENKEKFKERRICFLLFSLSEKKMHTC
jgi:hypothetical protein